METEYRLKTSGRYYKKDCGTCGKYRLCYAIIEKENKDKIHGYICRYCKDIMKRRLKDGN